MKKLFVLVMSLLLVFGLTGCNSGNKVDAMAIYQEAWNKTNELNSSHITMATTMSLGSGDESLDMTIDIEAWQKNAVNLDTAEIIMDIKTSMYGFESIMRLYAVNGNFYLESEYGNYAISRDEIETYLASYTSEESMADVDLISNPKAKEVDGGYEITYELNQLLLMESMGSEYASYIASGGLKIKNASGTAFIDKDGLIRSSSMQLTLELSDGSITMVIDTLTSGTTEALPADYAFDYPDFSEFENMEDIIDY